MLTQLCYNFKTSVMHWEALVVGLKVFFWLYG